MTTTTVYEPTAEERARLAPYAEYYLTARHACGYTDTTQHEAWCTAALAIGDRWLWERLMGRVE